MDEYSSKWPLWLDGVGQDTDDTFVLSPDLASRLRSWALEFDTEYDFDSGWSSAAVYLAHVTVGNELRAEVAAALGPGFYVELITINEPWAPYSTP